MKTKIAQIGFILLMFSCCSQVTTTPLDPFFNELKRKIDKERLDEFKYAPRDSSIFYFMEFKSELIDVIENSGYYKDADSFIDNLGISDDFEIRSIFLNFAFHSKLNDKSFSIEEIKQDFERYKVKAKVKEEKERKMYNQKSLRLVQASNMRWNKGDTLDLILPVRIEDNDVKSTYFNGPYPHTLDYSRSDDTLKVKGILIDKYYEPYSESESVDSLDLIFKLKILELSDTSYHILWKKYRIGDEFDLPIKDYGRPIE